MRYDTLTPYMLGRGDRATARRQVLTKRAWDRIPDAAKPAVLEAARAAEQQMQRQIPADERKAVDEMEKRGLKVIRVKGTKDETRSRRLPRRTRTRCGRVGAPGRVRRGRQGARCLPGPQGTQQMTRRNVAR